MADNTIGDDESFHENLKVAAPAEKPMPKMIVECDRRGPMSSSPASTRIINEARSASHVRQSRKPNHTIGLASAQGSSESAISVRPAPRSAASGGSVNASEAGSPWLGSAAAVMLPILPMPDPPYVSASVLRISRHRPFSGTPTR